MASDQTATSPPDGIAFSGKRFKVRVESLPQAIGGVARFEIVETPAAAAVVPLLEPPAGGEPLVLLVEQERPAVGQRTLEIPAGLIAGQAAGAAPEAPEQTALRELREETGYSADGAALQLLTRLYSSPGITNEVIHIYLARDIPPRAQEATPADPTEIARVHTLPLSDAVALIGRGEIRDAKTIAGLLLARDALRGGQDGTSQASGNGDATMPIDPTQIPLTAISAEAGGAKPNPLSAETILTQEFGYANVTAYQAQEDRARFFGLYLTLVGILAAALGAVAQLGGSLNRELLLPVAALLLALAGGLGIIFFQQLIKFREAWFQSALAMNTIKEYYIEQLRKELPNIDEAFLWRMKTLPRTDKPGTPTYLVCYTTAFISSLCTAVAIATVGGWLASNGWIQSGAQAVGINPGQIWLDTGAYGLWGVLGIVAFLVSMRWMTNFYKNHLRSNKRGQEIAQQEQNFANN